MFHVTAVHKKAVRHWSLRVSRARTRPSVQRRIQHRGFGHDERDPVPSWPIDESLTNVTFNGSFGNLLDGTLALDASGPVVDVLNFKESNLLYLGGEANFSIGWSLDNVEFLPLHSFKDSSNYTLHLNLSGIKYLRLTCDGGPDVDESASVDGQMTVVSQS